MQASKADEKIERTASGTPRKIGQKKVSSQMSLRSNSKSNKGSVVKVIKKESDLGVGSNSSESK